jgi:predicted O-methyltransferase YrrM
LSPVRSFRHWTPRYLLDRARDKSYRQAHPEQPWLAPEAIRFLEGYLRPSDMGLEFGSGHSTLWFARRLAALTSVEHDPVWGERVRAMLVEGGVKNVTYLVIDLEAGQPGQAPDYVRASERFAERSLDFVLVDGRRRDECALAVLPKLRPGGLFVLDNADVYLPSDQHTPNARQTPDGPGWAQFLDLVRGWRCFWTGNGVYATAMWWKEIETN